MAKENRKPIRLHLEVKDRPDDLIACIVLALLLVALVVLAPDSLARQALGLVFLLFLPGYVTTAALFPDNDQLDGIERVALSFGLSIAIVPLIGLGLNFTPWGISLEPILASASGFIIGVSLAAWLRRVRLPEDERFAIVVDVELDFWKMPLVDKVLTVGIAVMLVASVVVLAWAVTNPRVGERYTQLAILGAGGMAAGYPEELAVGEDARVLLSIMSFEHRTADYTIAIVITNLTDNTTSVDSWSIDWGTIHTLTPNRAIAQNLTLDHEQYYNQTFDFDIAAEGVWKLQFLLLIDGEPVSQDAYRETHLWLTIWP